MSEPSATSGPLHLIPDAPISNPNFDRLDRMAFVRSFSEAIRAVKGNDSVVLGLAGPWGSGKSSLINLICGELERTPGDRKPPLVMKFNPWWFTGTDGLVAAFLGQLAAAVSRPTVVDMLGGATVGLDHLSDAIAAPGGQRHAEDIASRDIEVIRDTLDSIFRNSDRRILIFMDDIDRLTPEEMTQLLLIVRAVADFPNTTYVLSFDYEVVVNAIGDKLGVDGRTYLEKVIQLQIDVPLPGRMTLERMVVGQLQAIDPNSQGLDEESQREFRTLFEVGIKHFLGTPRACTRLLNVLRFTFPTLAGQVHFPDMLGISCLMSFSSQAIQAMRSYTDAFVGHCDASGRGWVSYRNFHLAWLAEIPKRDRAFVEAICRLMFPKVAWALNGPLRGEQHAATWDRQKRICSVKHFETYFRLGLSAGEVAEHQWQNMVELLDDATAFSRALKRFGPLEEGGGSGWVGELLQKASDFVNDQASPEQAGNLFRAIIQRGDEIAAVKDDSGEGDSLTIDHTHRLVWLLVDCLQRVDDPADRFDVIAASIAEDAGLLVSAELLDALDYRSDIFATEGDLPAKSNTKLPALLKVFDKRMQEASESGEVAMHPQFVKLLKKWRQFGRLAKSREMLRQICESGDRFAAMLLQVGGPPTDDGTPQKLPLEILTEFFDRKELLTRCLEILREPPEALTPDGARIIKTLASQLQGTKRPKQST